MRKAILDSNNAVTAIHVVTDLDGGIDGAGAAIGDTWDGTQFVKPPPPVPDPAQIKSALVAAVQSHLDTTAQQRGYDGILSLASYAASPNPPFAAEGDAGLAWRDAVWIYCYGVMAAVEAGTRPVPTADALIAELPPMIWPT